MDAFTESAVSSDLGMMDGTTIKTIRCKAASSFFFFFTSDTDRWEHRTLFLFLH